MDTKEDALSSQAKPVRKSPVPSDIEIAQAATMQPIQDIAAKAGILEEELELYGRYKAKIDYMAVLKRLKDKPDGKIINVTAITPTPLGEGKTVTAVGLTESMNAIGIDTMLALREPSLGPVFGIKGGAAGGGYSQLIPMEDLNLHFTGDIHAVGTANNLLAAMVDSHLMHGNELNIDPLSISWRRCVDLNDRAMREIVNGLGGKLNGIPRQTGYDITVASEVMAILGLATSLEDLRKRLGRITFGYSTSGKPLTADDIGAGGAMTVLLKDAIKPNIMQTLEGNAALVHAGPFANIAHGNNSIIADKIALKLSDYVVTESGFGADLRLREVHGHHLPVRRLRAQRRGHHVHHAGPQDARRRCRSTRKLLKAENNEALTKGCENLAKQIENMKLFGVPVVVTINRFAFDRDTEVEIVRKEAVAAGAEDAVPINVHALGGDGGQEAAEVVKAAADKGGGLQVPLPARGLHQGEDRDHRHQDLRRRRRRLPAGGRGEDQALHGAGSRQAAHLHGEDAPVALPRPGAQGPAARFPRADPRHPARDRRRVPLPAARRDAHHARSGQAAGRRGRRHRRPDRPHHRPVLRI